MSGSHAHCICNMIVVSYMSSPVIAMYLLVVYCVRSQLYVVY